MDRQLDVHGLRFLQSAGLIIDRQRVDIYTDHFLGKGSYCKVFKATFDSAVCVAKKLHPELLLGENGKWAIPYRRFLSECKISCRIRHPHVVQFFGVTIDDGVLCLIMEIMHQSLSARISSETQFSRIEKINIAEGIAAGLKYLHKSPLRIVHRDLSANNILLSFDGKAKICDFGLAKELPKGDVVKSTRCPGTPTYMAPEALGDPAIYTTASDMYSYGVLLVEIDIQEGVTSDTRKDAIQRMDRSGVLYSISLECLRDDRRQRLNAEMVSDILKSSYDGQSSIVNAVSACMSEPRIDKFCCEFSMHVCLYICVA